MRTYRRHTLSEKLHILHLVTTGELGRREAERRFQLSRALMQRWLTSYASGNMCAVPEVQEVLQDRERRIEELRLDLQALVAEHGWMRRAVASCPRMK